MDAQPRRFARFWVVIRATYAWWPGGRHRAIKLTADGVPGEVLVLLDREGRRQEFRAYRAGERYGRPR